MSYIIHRENNISYSEQYLGTEATNDIYHFKYIKKEKKNGKWRYYYDKDVLSKEIKKKFDSVYNDPNNIYDVSASNYDKRMKQIEQSKEWQDIVRRKDPEYVRKNKDGTTTYLMDDYLVKKKHPELDAIDDIGAGRKISINKVTTKSLIAGGKDYVKTVQTVIGLAARVLTEKIKYQQGTYKDEQDTISRNVNQGIRFVSALSKYYYDN